MWHIYVGVLGISGSAQCSTEKLAFVIHVDGGSGNAREKYRATGQERPTTCACVDDLEEGVRKQTCGGFGDSREVLRQPCPIRRPANPFNATTDRVLPLTTGAEGEP